MEPAVARHMLQGAADPLHSEFHLTYAMLLALARSSADVTAESLLSKSFRQYQAQRAIPGLQQRIGALQVRSYPHQLLVAGCLAVRVAAG